VECSHKLYQSSLNPISTPSSIYSHLVLGDDPLFLECLNLRESMDSVLVQPVGSEVALNTLLLIYTHIHMAKSILT
jgi:hypothetical protein